MVPHNNLPPTQRGTSSLGRASCRVLIEAATGGRWEDSASAPLSLPLRGRLLTKLTPSLALATACPRAAPRPPVPTVCGAAVSSPRSAATADRAPLYPPPRSLGLPSICAVQPWRPRSARSRTARAPACAPCSSQRSASSPAPPARWPRPSTTATTSGFPGGRASGCAQPRRRRPATAPRASATARTTWRAACGCRPSRGDRARCWCTTS